MKRVNMSLITPTLLLSILLNSSVRSQEPDPGLVVFSSGFSSPVNIAHTSDSRLFVVEKAGRIRAVDESGMISDPPFLSIPEKVDSTGGEQGLLGLAFHPDYDANGYFYVNYTDLSGDTVISRYSVSGNPDAADENSEVILMEISQPYDNHNGGDLHFGPDGYLYVFTGDGGSGGDPSNFAQNPQSLLGKILRIDVDGGSPYAIPLDNPFVADPAVLDEIWAIGLRNPWRTSFDRLTGDLWIADVGQSTREEINLQSASSSGGENYGWRCYEGSLPYNTDGCDIPETYVFPVFDYAHPPHCSVTGGYVYRGSDYPGLYGRYFFTDYCSGNFWSLEPSGMGGFDVTDFGVRVTFITSFGENAAGELFACSLQNGNLYRVVDFNMAATPTPAATPTATPLPDGLKVDITLSGTSFKAGDPFELTFRIENLEPVTITGNFWMMLDVYGSYWFHPDWTETADFLPIDLATGMLIGPETVLDFTWPSGVNGHADGLMFHGAVTNSGNNLLLSNLDSVIFGY